MIRIRTLIPTSLAIALTVALGAGCKPEPPGGTTPPESGDATADAGKKNRGNKGGDKGGDAGDADAGGAGEGGGGQDLLAKAIATKCPADVNQEAPTSVFGDAVLIRLPKGVAQFVEETPSFAYMNPKPAASTTCVEGVPEATITNGIMGYYEDDQKKDIKETAKETLEALGYVSATIENEEVGGKGDRRTYTAVLDVPEDDKNPPAMAMLHLKSAHGRMHYVIWETHPDAWNALEATFRESANKMLLLNP